MFPWAERLLTGGIAIPGARGARTGGGYQIFPSTFRRLFMARRKLPLSVAKVTGAATINPGRYRNDASPKVGPLGPAPETLSPAEAEVWAELAAELPWLAKSDRALVSIACRLLARFQAGDLPMGGLTELRLTLSALGATPTARGKISLSDTEPGDDPAADFLN